MRTLALGALAILCGAEIAQAQTWPASASYGSRPGGNPYYQAAPGGPGYPNFPQPRAANSPGVPYQNFPPSPWVPPPPPTAAAPVPAVAPQMAPQVAPPPNAAPTLENLTPLPSPDPVVVPAGEAVYPRDVPDAEPACPDRFWVSVEYASGWIQPQRDGVPLVTTGSLSDPRPGALGQPGTRVLVDSALDPGRSNGFRVDGGWFLDRQGCWSLDLGALYLAPVHVRAVGQSDDAGNPILTRPIINAVSGEESAFLDAFPGSAAGGFTVDARSELLGAEFNARYHYRGHGLHASALLGFRYLRLEESLEIQDNLRPLAANTLTFLGAAVNAPNQLVDADRFATQNQFIGPQVGGEVRWDHEWFFVSAHTKVGLGATSQKVAVNGSTTLLTPNGPQSINSGVLAVVSNSGRHQRSVFGFLPEVGLTVGVNVTPHLRLTAGYSFLYWNQVVRPGGQIDRTVNPGLVPTDRSFGQTTTPYRPAFTFNDESLWVQFLNLGVEIHY